MDNSQALADLTKFINKYRTSFEELPRRYSALFEVIGLMVIVKRLESNGYKVSTKNLKAGKFKVKLTASGYPANFSHFECRKGNRIYELHCNLLVQGHGGCGRYCVDVGIVRGGRVKVNGKISNWSGVLNGDLASFAEMKKLNVYPMLIAQFIGIVYQIKRKCIVEGVATKVPIPPTLIAEGYMTAQCVGVQKGIKDEGMKISIVTNASYAVKMKTEELEL